MGVNAKMVLCASLFSSTYTHLGFTVRTFHNDLVTSHLTADRIVIKVSRERHHEPLQTAHFLSLWQQLCLSDELH